MNDQESLKRKLEMDINDPLDLNEASCSSSTTRHRVRPRPLGEEFKSQLTARVDRIESLVNLLITQNEQEDEAGTSLEDSNEFIDNDEHPKVISKAIRVKASISPKILNSESLKSQFTEKERLKKNQDMIKKKFEDQKKMAQEIKKDQYPPELQEIAKQFPLQSVDALIQINDEIYCNDVLRNDLAKFLTHIKERLPKTFNRGVNAIIDVSVGRFLNWTGQHDKINLSSLPLFSEILPEIWYPSLTVEEYQQLITSDLKKKAKTNFSQLGSSKRALTGSD